LSEVICNTSPLQYLYQLDMVHIFQALTEGVIVPPTVVHELAIGRAQRASLPDPTVLDEIGESYLIGSRWNYPLITSTRLKW